ELLKKNFGDGKLGVKVIYHEKNMGKGKAIRSAIENAAGDFCVIQDADLEYDPADLKKMLAYLEEHSGDVVYGSRFLDTWKVTSLPHFLVNRALTGLTNVLFGSKLTDMETCYKMVRREVMSGLGLRAERFELEPEITVKLLKKGYKIPEVPVSYKGRSFHEGKKIGWKDGVETLWTLIRMRIRGVID
ncbi:MAG: glycosyltransferase family 2 protein, partial [Candidatus Omnitrophota bacterium]